MKFGGVKGNKNAGHTWSVPGKMSGVEFGRRFLTLKGLVVAAEAMEVLTNERQ